MMYGRGPMKKFYIVTNEIKDKDFIVTNEVGALIHQLGGEVIYGHETCLDEIDKVDCILTLGGDGTLIRTANKFHQIGIPLIGINLGNLGYLTEIELDNLQSGILSICEGNYTLEKRMMLQGKVCDRKAIALNDIVISSKDRPSILSFDIYINGKFLHSYKADGIIISTPTGSTGYNMSAGGPIVDPSASLLVVTPICAHSLHGRSIVLSDGDVIDIILNKKHQGLIQNACVAYDGEVMMDLYDEMSLVIKKSSHSINLLKLDKGSFLETLSKKMEA